MACSSLGSPEEATAGERWSREVLAELRAARYRPAAWRAFIAASLERAAATRRARPRLARQADAWAAAWLAAAAAARARPLERLLPRVPAAAELAWWAPASAMLRWHLGMVEGPEGEPRRRLSAADALTLARIWLAPRLARSREPAAFAALLAAGSAADALDGLLARAAGQTRLGRDLDRVADLCLFGAAVRAARRAGWLDPAAARAFAVRYAVGTGYTALHYFSAGTPPRHDSRRFTHAATPVFVAGLLAAAAGRRRAGSAAVAAAQVATLAGQLTAARVARRRGTAESAHRRGTADSARRRGTADSARRRGTADSAGP